jgi:hypothetical protein
VDPAEEVDRRRVRVGLVIVGVMVVVAVVLLAIIDEPVGRAVMTAVLFAALVRAAFLVRTIRRR